MRQIINQKGLADEQRERRESQGGQQAVDPSVSAAIQASCTGLRLKKCLTMLLHALTLAYKASDVLHDLYYSQRPRSRIGPNINSRYARSCETISGADLYAETRRILGGSWFWGKASPYYMTLHISPLQLRLQLPALSPTHWWRNIRLRQAIN